MADLLPPIAEDDKMLSGLTYPLWPFIVPIVLYGPRREEPYVHFNALQSLALGAATLACTVVLGMVTWLIFFLLPATAIAISGIIGLVVFIVLVFLACFYCTVIVYIAWRAANGAFMKLPIIGQWAENRMQMNLGITSDSYGSGILGERREVRLDPFDYLAAGGGHQTDKSVEEQPHEAMRALRPQVIAEGEQYADDMSIEYVSPSSEQSDDPYAVLNETEDDNSRRDSRASSSDRQQPKESGEFRSLADTLGPRGRSGGGQSRSSRGGAFKWDDTFGAGESGGRKSSGDDEFKAGLVGGRGRDTRSSKAGFQWDVLDDALKPSSDKRRSDKPKESSGDGFKAWP